MTGSAARASHKPPRIMPLGLPLVDELPLPISPEQVFNRLCALPHCVFLDSALRHPTLGRYSFVAADPFDWIESPAGSAEPLALLEAKLRGLAAERIAGLPPFQGGAAGLLSYDLGRSLETLPASRRDEFQVPVLAMGLYDVVFAFDHTKDRAWLISQGFPETEPAARAQRAQSRLDWFRALALGETPTNAGRQVTEFPGSSAAHLTMQQLAPQYPVSQDKRLTSNFSRAAYLAAVQRVIDYIYAGDTYQVNLSQRLLTPARDDSVSLYLRLRACNPAPFAGYFDLGEFQIVSASPERFLSVVDRVVETRPIKGTRPRCGDETLDRAAAAELLASEKDRAENVMIVDLMRNDLARVCEAASVRVSQFCAVEAYAYVLHLVSAVRGRLQSGHSPIDLLRAAFPGGSVTGAPKIRAMQIIAELEPTARGPYCGSLGYLGFDGQMDLSILIRTITADRGWWQLPVGGGIVADSDPQREYEETWHKAEGLLQALSPEV